MIKKENGNCFRGKWTNMNLNPKTTKKLSSLEKIKQKTVKMQHEMYICVQLSAAN